MPDPFADLIPEARNFLVELANNNNRDWFKAHKTRYDAKLSTPARLLLDQFAHKISPGVTTKLFRPQRDVRFSKDKTPYNTYLHMLWTLPDGTRQNPALFFGIAPDYVTVGGGVMGFDKSVLPDWRAAVANALGAKMQHEIDRLRGFGMRIDEPELKRVPAPYDKTHPQGELLRRKALTVWRDLDERQYATPIAALHETLERLHPLNTLLLQIL